MSKTKLTFCGGAGSVTGSNFLVESEQMKLLVDCGLFQGCDFCDESNWEAFPYDPKSIQFLLVTHAHIDHIGRIPKLVRDGFRGNILSTPATKAIAEPILLDSMELLRQDAHKHGRGVLYEEKDIAETMKLWQELSYRDKQPLLDGFSVELLNAGHILGSAMMRLTRQGQAVIFTGDLGGTSLVLAPRESIAGAAYLVMESVYGDKTRGISEEYRREELKRVIFQIAGRKGTLLIPAFSTERTQELLFELRMLFEEKQVPSMPVYLDSPLAELITRAFIAHPDYFKEDIALRIKQGEDIFAFRELRYVENQNESEELRKEPGPKIIIAGSGMSSGGRVLAHERDILPDPQSILLIVGYQAAGSLGRELLEGAVQIEIKKEKVLVRAKVESNFGYSAHMDGPNLLHVVAEAEKSLQKVFVVMGEPASSSFLVQRIRDQLGLMAQAPQKGAAVELDL